MGKPIESDKSESVTVTDNRTGKTITVPISNNSIPATAFKQLSVKPDSNLRSKNSRPEDDIETGIRVYDPGFMNTAVIQSKITYINGGAGELRYRGYPIEQLAEHSSYLEVSYLLLYGELPTKDQFNHFENEVMRHTYVHVDLEQLVSSFRYDAHPMAILISSLGALGAFSPEANPSLQGQNLYTRPQNPLSRQVMDKQIFRLLGKSISIAAMAYRIRMGRAFNRPPVGRTYTETFLYMLDYLNEGEGYRPNPVIAKALDVLFILHADHELNAGTATMLQTGSTLVDPYSAVAAATAALYGPLHGGANEAVIRMLIRIGSPANVKPFIELVKQKKEVLSGFGHRVYKTSDPRSFIIRKTADEVFAVTGKDKLLDTAIALHEAALKDEYFKSRNLYPFNFWSGLIYRALGFPTDFYPVLFAVPRIVGWLSHWRQMQHQAGGVKIWRPRQVYIGEGSRDYVRIEDRIKKVKHQAEEPSRVDHVFSTRHFLAQWNGKGESLKDGSKL
ncbi:citrate synthase-like protein [Phakopsora pachyrhizi]|nr:citrate synthase-like protein [Phakopsora pachyrhizi]